MNNESDNTKKVDAILKDIKLVLTCSQLLPLLGKKIRPIPKVMHMIN